MAWSAVGDFSGTAYRPPQIHNLPSHNSKMVLSIVKIGPPVWAGTFFEESQRLGSQAAQPHLEDGSVYREKRPTIVYGRQNRLRALARGSVSITPAIPPEGSSILGSTKLDKI